MQNTAFPVQWMGSWRPCLHKRLQLFVSNEPVEFAAFLRLEFQLTQRIEADGLLDETQELRLVGVDGEMALRVEAPEVG